LDLGGDGCRHGKTNQQEESMERRHSSRHDAPRAPRASPCKRRCDRDLPPRLLFARSG
jgi:hypothetical protein